MLFGRKRKAKEEENNDEVEEVVKVGMIDVSAAVQCVDLIVTASVYGMAD